MTINYYVRTTGDRVLNKSYSQITYQLIYDREHKPIDSFINTLYLINTENSVLLEDDLILCNQFKNEIESVIKEFPNRIINFFQAPLLYQDILESSDIFYNQCTYYPKGLSSKIADIMIGLPRHEGKEKTCILYWNLLH